MTTVTTIGIDLAKNVFQLHGADSKGRDVFNKKVSRKKLLLFFANHQPCLVGMEACLLFLVSTPRAGRTDCWDISKRGNTYLRTMLIHGGRSVLRHCPKKEDRRSIWLRELAERRGNARAAVAQANKMAR